MLSPGKNMAHRILEYVAIALVLFSIKLSLTMSFASNAVRMLHN